MCSTSSRQRLDLTIWKRCVLGILLLSITFKLFAIVNPTKLMDQTDHVLHVQIRYVIVVACIAEIFLCAFLYLTASQLKTIWSVFAFSVLILLYRTLASANGAITCPCLGNVADWWPWLGRHEGPILTSVAIWLFLTSAIQLIPGREDS